MKKFGLLLILAFTTFFSSCEKDLYEEAVYEQPKLNGKFSTVSIEDAPFLKPSIESFKSKHFNHSNGVAYRAIDSLDLDLNKIAVYEKENGVKSYSIAVKESIFENEDYYFENLHILESGDKYEYFIIKYNPLDDSKKFDYATYTGKMEVYNEDRKFVGTIVFENGAFKLIDTTPPTGEEPIGGGGGSDPTDPDCPCNSNSPSLLSQFFSWIGDLFSNINITPGSPDNTGYVLIATSPNIGSTNNNTTPTQTTSGNNIAVTPNEPEWTYPVSSQLVMANKIKSRLIYSNPEILPWLKNPINHDIVDQLYFYMAEGGNNAEINTFASEAVVSLINGGNVDIQNEIILDPTIVNNQKIKCVYDKLKSLSTSHFKDIINNVFGSEKEAQIRFKAGNIPEDEYLARTYPSINGVGKRFFNIVLDNDYVTNASTLEIAVTLIHELFHAELAERCYQTGIISGALPNGTFIFTSGVDTGQLNNQIFNQLVQEYISFIPTNNNPYEFQHNLFTILKYRNLIISDLTNINPQLDPNNNFQTIINNDPFINSMQDVIKNLSWLGLEETDDYNLLSPENIANIEHTNNRVSQYYTKNCN